MDERFNFLKYHLHSNWKTRDHHHWHYVKNCVEQISFQVFHQRARGVLDYHPNQTYVRDPFEMLDKPMNLEIRRGTYGWIAQHWRPVWRLHQQLNHDLTSDPNSNKWLDTLIKSKQHVHLGVAPHRDGNIIFYEPMQKANIHNRQFTSVFRDDTKKSLPDLGPSRCLSMEDITASCEGMVRLLKNPMPRKAAGPDDFLWCYSKRQQQILFR